MDCVKEDMLTKRVDSDMTADEMYERAAHSWFYTLQGQGQGDDNEDVMIIYMGWLLGTSTFTLQISLKVYDEDIRST